MKGPFKLLVFASYLGSGGAEKHTVRLLNHLDPKAFEIYVVTPNKKGTYEQDLLPHIRLIKIGSKKAFQLSATLARLSCILPLRKQINRLQPDLVITVTDLHTLIYLYATKGVKRKVKHIALVQNTISETYGKTVSLTKKIIYSSILSQYHKIDKIVAISQGVAQDLLHLMPALEQKVMIIYNIGIDQDLQTKASPIAISENRPIVLACGRLVPQKGYPYLIKAFAQMRSKVPATLLILGEGKLMDEVVQLIKDYRLQDHVKLLGFRANPYEYMASADLFVLSSVYEGFGNVIVEAMACNAPVISTDCPHGPSEIIQHGINGWLVPVKDPDKLATSMSELLLNQELRNTLRKNGMKRAMDFEASKIAHQYEKLMQSLLIN
ncbi:glycosyltransferase involved in cell wall biosynthesis [Catalinimonas alkaloidigena]|uniref:glycosyltransferase n=1 Tax=Catalinimonas alkaloidigena TaxID=1075417 RepID=UPI002404DDE7|nr:glycosyltransferase [Catalinimonas alkaloidigena]MDF9799690.1 glycosyltransferase involved in cell wall biosynthesis [Catalinimonas alkaloidigena]